MVIIVLGTKTTVSSQNDFFYHFVTCWIVYCCLTRYKKNLKALKTEVCSCVRHAIKILSLVF